ncbi:DUF4333 domain-containing protein [Antrihabitans stalactiti]|uniref:DUF4333 domain-containing protein n=1 Tax=Antrihabitans stalactiti TaxID=2584121 RepID=A0A848KA31_9NOCA|nr:DUF4333 domain-containing protein [Antrihabitans stalactiti]NMN94506.1 DUF4333 domain-containing protein [Antrihabitans stalactiti]
MRNMQVRALVAVALAASLGGVTVACDKSDHTESATAAPGADSSTTAIDRESLELGVAKVLVDSFRAKDAVADCPDPLHEKAGATVTCKVNISGSHATVVVTSTDDQGGYEVAKPR